MNSSGSSSRIFTEDEDFLSFMNLGMNRLKSLPRGFGSFPILEVLDLSYNMLNEESLPENFFMLHTLRALYLR